MTEDRWAWWKDTAERLIWTFVQGAIGVPIGVEIIELLTDTELAIGYLFGMLAGGIGAVLSFVKSVAADKLTRGGTAQMGVHTYSYTEAGPGSAGGDLD